MSLSDYQILEEIGKGRDGVIYRGLDLRNRREVAIKKMALGRRAQLEVDNHIQFSGSPLLYDHFKEESHLWLIMELIHGDGLHNTWGQLQNWDFNWMTVYHALMAIKNLHESGYSHGDLHLNNYIWTGTSIVIIDFSTLINRRRALELLQKERDEISLSLSPGWEMELDYDPYEDINNHQRSILQSFCSDYRDLISEANYVRLDDQGQFSNSNKGFERYELLIKYIRNLPCERRDSTDVYRDYLWFADAILREYQRIDNLDSDLIA